MAENPNDMPTAADYATASAGNAHQKADSALVLIAKLEARVLQLEQTLKSLLEGEPGSPLP